MLLEVPVLGVHIWMWLKIKLEGQTAGFGPCFHLTGFHVGTGFLSHSHSGCSPWFERESITRDIC